ncbi:hypothetical protein O3P69_009753 [Scylla paramamosain]|uniref:Major facilitator superfamily (MFS) profile domain-containing protein n=1 Tax=Scylla paramamosain TaxID=85552 RepID=A0AAW0SMC3_SCYPA
MEGYNKAQNERCQCRPSSCRGRVLSHQLLQLDTTTTTTTATATQAHLTMLSQLDDVLTHLGSGRWTVLHFLTLAYNCIFVGPQALGGAFLAPRLDYTCQSTTIPSSASFELATDGLASYTQANHTTLQYDPKCQYWVNTPEGGTIEECVEFVFDNSTFSSTFTSEYNLACDRAYLQTSFQSVYMFGVFVSAPINGYLSDKYGRKRALMAGTLLFLIIALGSAWLPFLSTVLLARFLLGVFHAMSNITSYVLLVEVMNPKIRPVVGYAVNIFWASSMMIYSAFGYWIRDWRLLQTVNTLPGFLILPGLWLIDESPRWLIVNGRPREALQVLTKAASWHGVDLPPEGEMKTLMQEQNDTGKSERQPISLWRLIGTFKDEIVILFRTPRLRIITICVFLDYMISGMVYFGLSLSGASISDNPFVFMALSGLMEIPAYTLTIPVVQCFGRRRTLATCFLLSAIVLFALAVIPAEYSVTVVALAMIGKMSITAGFQTTIFFSSELFPTEVRSRGIGGAYMMSRIGSMVSPFITDLVGSVYPWAPFVVFGAGALLSGGVTFLLPETKGQTLPDTVAQLEEKSCRQED